MAQFEVEQITYLGERKEEIDFRIAYVRIDDYLDWEVIIRGTTDKYILFIETMKKNEQPLFEFITTEGEVFQGRTKIMKFIPKLTDTEIDLFGIGKLNGYEIKSVQ
ncbi:hypothetical protein H9I32_09230 [Bacillus sp. Xin]|uniref:hypothetical protein n=1 Tax=unclassified Bacillus (in: firmicutes) TaxID=185979 RepID=UPI001573CE8F|nr:MULTISPECIES: hypothetical protein [unclassified Bacillus (in: firmicutes)]MBC6972575.1 hypothetical protein [Bacillus sp. Xin]NSW38806.1 hypothetical protein [Bacillus sp. Xin1]